jgi:hypothetical protein
MHQEMEAALDDHGCKPGLKLLMCLGRQARR